jgi:hypothetical protein
MTKQPSKPVTRVTSHAKQLPHEAKAQCGDPRQGRGVHETAQIAPVPATAQIAPVPATAQIAPVPAYPTTLESIAPAGQRHLYAEYRGLRYYLVSGARGHVIVDLANGLQKILPRVVSLYLTDRRGCTAIDGDAQRLRNALVYEFNSSFDAVAFDSLLNTSSDHPSMDTCTSFAAPRPLFDIARDILRLWRDKKGVPAISYAAKPYLDAMLSVRTTADMYGYDSAASIVRYFLSNASSWRGPDAVRIKNELRAHLGEKPVQSRAPARRI